MSNDIREWCAVVLLGVSAVIGPFLWRLAFGPLVAAFVIQRLIEANYKRTK